MNKKHRVLFKLCFSFIAQVTIWMVFSTSFAQEAIDIKDPKNPPTKIRIITDQAIINSKNNYTEFSGNVKLTIDDTQISADWIKVTTLSDIKKISHLSIDEKAIDTILAKGNVKIQMNDMVANTEEAIYSSSEDTFILTGENSTISSGNDTIVCDKITINVKDQTFKAESTGKTPVEAIFYDEPKNP